MRGLQAGAQVSVWDCGDAAEKRGGANMVLADNRVMVTECGPWAGCPLGTDCPQAVTQQACTLHCRAPVTGCYGAQGPLSSRWLPVMGLAVHLPVGSVWDRRPGVGAP